MSRFQKPDGERKNDTVETFSVLNVRNTDHGCFFTLILNEVTINNVKVATTKDGRDFIALPSYRGKDGKYYNTVYFRFGDGDTDKILDEVCKALGV